jgi:D-alanyl-D-alanine dipeptidase
MNVHDESARRSFWTEHMERSRALLEAMERYPVQECSEGFASIRDAAVDDGVEMMFSETKLAGKFDRILFIRKSLIKDLLRVARDMNKRGWILKIEDGFRTEEMQVALGRNPILFDQIVRMCLWENEGCPPSLDLIFRRAKCLVAIVPCNGTHLFGAAMDISVFGRDDGAEVWRGGPYLEMSERTPMVSPFVSAQEQENRRAITGLMERHGFMHYPGEFWHFNKGDAMAQMLTKSGKPGIYGPVHWDSATNTVTPFLNPSAPLTPPEEFQRLIESAFQRIAMKIPANIQT